MLTMVSTATLNKNRSIVNELREQILRGDFGPGQALPPYAALEQRFGVGTATVHRAIGILQRDGFVRARHRVGMFVTEHPPHLCRYVLVVPADESYNRIYAALAGEARAWSQHGEIEIQPSHVLDGHQDTPEYQTLVHDLRAHRVAGLIFASSPFRLRGSPILEQPAVPRVALMSGPVIEKPFVAALKVDWQSFITKAVAYFRRRQRRRVAVLFVTPFPESAFDHLRAELAAAGIDWPRHWRLGYGLPTPPEGVRNAVHLLLDSPNKPDALLVLNDNLLEATTAGLIDAGVHGPEDVDVVAHTNFGWETPSLLRVKRLGFDPYRILETSLDLLARQRQGEPVPGVSRLEAVWEDELSVRRRPPAGKRLLTQAVGLAQPAHGLG